MSVVIDKSLSSSVLLITDQRVTLPQLEVDHLPPEFHVLEKTLSQTWHDVLVFPMRLLRDERFWRLFAQARESHPSVQMIAVEGDGGVATPAEDLLAWHQKLSFSKILLSFEDNRLESFLVECIERARALRQERELQELLTQQNQKLQTLHLDLEERVDKRQRYLEESLRKTAVANSRWQKLREALIAIHRSLSVASMEKNLLEVLRDSLSLSSVRIFFRPHDQYFAMHFRNTLSLASFQAPLSRLQLVVGSVFFIRDPKLPFHREETDFLLRISEGLSLAIDRLSELQQSENLSEQWQATFNAIKDPVVLINANYEVVQANSSARARGDSGKKCFEILYSRKAPCVGCQLGQRFRIETKSEIFEVSSHAIMDGKERMHVNLYHDVSEQIRMERKILETARLAELGTIGSSIAHELNNPLGGVLSFVQLMKMDCKKEDPLYEELDEMEKGVKRCRDIIENLLGFTRNPESDQITDLDLRDVVERAIKIVDLQVRSRNTELRSHIPKTKLPYRGHLNILAQALQHVLQLAVDVADESESRGQIEIRISVQSKDYVIEILDNGPGEQRRNSLHFSIASQIFHEQGGILELSQAEGGLTRAKISLPRPA